MRKLLSCVAIALLVMGGIAITQFISAPSANAADNPVGSIDVLALKDLDGNTVMFGNEALGKGQIAFCFLTNWSKLSIDQAKDVLASADAFKASGGTLVMICAGADADATHFGSRRVRQEIDPTGKGFWLSPKHAEEVTIDNRQMTSIEVKFANAFRTLSRAERVPALVISDQKGRVTFAQHGRMSAEEISKALGAN